LYELLTGKRAFAGETLQDTMAAVREREPDWGALPPKTPLKITALLRRCVQKAPDLRPQSVTELRVIVEQSLRRGSRWRWAGVAAALAITAAGAFWTWRTLEQQRNAIHVPTITRLTTDSGLTAYPALSRDGKLLAYSSDRASNGNLDIWIQQTAGGNPVRLTTNGADDLEPSFFPDGSRIVFRSERDGGGIYEVPTLGGLEGRLADLGRSPRVSPDGKWIAYWVGDQSYYGHRQIFVIPANGGQPRNIQPKFFSASRPVWSPDGERLLFRGARDPKAAEAGHFDWWVSSLDPGPAVQTGGFELLRQSKLAAMERSQLNGGFGVEPSEWTRDSIVFSASSGSAGLSGSLWRAKIDSRYRIQGPVQRLTSGTENQLQPSAIGSYIAFASVTQNENIWSLAVDPNTGRVSGEPLRVTTTTAADVLPAPSADGRKVAFASNRTGNMHIWLKDLATGTEVPLTSTPFNELPWLLNPDGSLLVYCVFGAPESSLERVALFGQQTAEWPANFAGTVLSQTSSTGSIATAKSSTKKASPPKRNSISATSIPDGTPAAASSQVQRHCCAVFSGWPLDVVPDRDRGCDQKTDLRHPDLQRHRCTGVRMGADHRRLRSRPQCGVVA
jgi:Tol biopolymer transport system component